MPHQCSPEFRQRALRLLDTSMEASEVSEFEAVKPAVSKLDISEESVRRWRRKATASNETPFVVEQTVTAVPSCHSALVMPQVERVGAHRTQRVTPLGLEGKIIARPVSDAAEPAQSCGVLGYQHLGCRAPGPALDQETECVSSSVDTVGSTSPMRY